jgi:hypothetical protein
MTRILALSTISALSALLTCATLAAPAFAADFQSAEAVLANFKSEPTVNDIQQMVLEYSKTDNRYVEGWLAASKSAALLPEVKVQYDYDNGYGQDFDYTDGTATSETLAGSGIDLKNAVTAYAKWSLSDLVMSSERIRVISETQDVVKLRDKILDEATRLYFDRRRLQVDILMNTGDVKTQIKNELRLQELTAQLDAYTGGRFSKALKKK